MKNKERPISKWLSCVAGILALQGALMAAERTEHFDADPGWHGHNNRATSPAARTVRQDFGYSPTTNAGGAAGEMGGLITAAGEAAYYAKRFPTRSFNDVLSASGKLVCAKGGFHVLLGFFNTNTINEWRTPSSIAIRLNGRGDHFFAYVEYCTSRWRAGGDSPGGFATVTNFVTGRMDLKGFPSGTNVHQWSMRYDPNGNGGGGSITVRLGNETSICHLDADLKADGATFNHFGLINVMKSADDAGRVWLDDMTVNGEMESFDRDPQWDEFHNRRTYLTEIVRPRFHFGYSPTRHAGGQGQGEMGGTIFRGDGRYTNTMAFYGAHLEELTLAKPLKASGKIVLRRGVTDSDVPFGFFHAAHSLDSGGSDRLSIPPDFLGVMIGGPSREGFMFTPGYRLHNTEKQAAQRGPYIFPDGRPHDWTLEYTPPTAGAPGSITVTLNGERATLPFPREHQTMSAHFNRFGLISTHTDGNSQDIYFDDLTYTSTQADLPKHSLLRGHTSSVMCVTFSPDGQLLASSSRDKTIRLWDARNGGLKQTLTGHTSDVYSVVFTRNGRTLASAGGDGTVRLYDVPGAKLVRTFTAHSDVVRWVAFSPDEKILASAGGDSTVRLWNTETWKSSATLTGHHGRVKFLTFSPDGQLLASGGDDKSVRVWNVARATLRTSWQAHESPLESVLFSPKEELLATSSNDGTVRLWRSGSWELQHTLIGHGVEVDSIAFSPDGQLLASGGKDKTLRLWNTGTGEQLTVIAAHEGRLESLAFSPDGESLASGGGGGDSAIKIWNVGKLLRNR